MIVQALHTISGMPLEVCADLLRAAICVSLGLAYVAGLVAIAIGAISACFWFGSKL